MALPAARCAELDDLASGIHGAMRATGATGALALPVDPAVIAREQAGLRVRVLAEGITGTVVANTDGRSVSGLLDFASGIIYVNGLEPETRQRFTIAHELAHELLGHEASLGRAHVVYHGMSHAELAPTTQEAEADHLAGRLLVPPDELDRAIAEIGTTSVPLLAARFAVSPVAMQVHARPYLPRMGRAQPMTGRRAGGGA